MSDFLSSSGDTTLNLLKNDLIDYSSTSSSISKSSLFKIDLVDISKKADLIPGKEVKLRGKFIKNENSHYFRIIKMNKNFSENSRF